MKIIKETVGGEREGLSREDLEKILTQRFKGAVLEINQRAFAMGCKAAGKGAV